MLTLGYNKVNSKPLGIDKYTSNHLKELEAINIWKCLSLTLE